MPVKEFFKFNMDTLTLVTKISGSLLKKGKNFDDFGEEKERQQKIQALTSSLAFEPDCAARCCCCSYNYSHM